MKTFTCTCGNQLFFENTRCNACGRTLGYLPDLRVLSAIEPAADDTWRALAEGAVGERYRMCANYSEANVCNWMLASGVSERYCRSCALNDVIPDLSQPSHQLLWARMETAKRRLLYTLDRLRLPVVARSADKQGLAFRFLADAAADSDFDEPLPGQPPVYTGHAEGVITINLAEADTLARVRERERMGERYRTLLGHFRHEVGHYYWQQLICGSERLASFRKLFGDERLDYAIALKSYHDAGAPGDWNQRFISAYASAHPWEDWAETWAHYLHLVDTLETASAFGFALQGRTVAPPPSQEESSPAQAKRDFERLLHDWVRLTVAINSINRSMGVTDAYPFVLSAPAIDKLHFVHRVIAEAALPK